MAQAIETQVLEILTRVGRVPAEILTPDSDLAAVGLDSITMVEVVFALEETFDIAVPYATDAGPIRVGHLVQSVQELVRAKQG